MTDTAQLPTSYNIGIDHQQIDVVSEAARRLAAVSVPLLCGTTDTGHLITLLDSVTLLADDLKKNSQVIHYIERICFYLEKHPDTQLEEKINRIFPEITKNYKRKQWMSGLPQRPAAHRPNTVVSRKSRAHHVPDHDLFVLHRSETDVEKVALLTMADLRDSLPAVACEMASYEAAWRGSSGKTAAALGIMLDKPESQHVKKVHVIVEQPGPPVPESKTKKPLIPKPKEPKTGREVVDHILSGMLTDQTYIAYLNKPIPTQPYHLEVVPKSKLNKEHFIMSSFGVMHVAQNGDNEVYSLSKWLRNARIYDYIIEIPFFKHFNLLRQFLRWRINAVLARFQRHRTLIKNELLITIPTYAKNMLQVQSLVCELMTIPEASLEMLIPGTLKNFSDTIQKQQHYLLKYITRFLQYIKQLDTAADQFLSNRLREAEVNNRPSPDYLTNPISIQKEKKHQRLQYLHQCRNDYNKMENYRSAIRLQVQFLVIDFIHKSTVHLVDRIHVFISEKSGSLVTINLVYSLNEQQDDIIISYPSLDSIQSTLYTLLTNLKLSIINCAKEWLPDNHLLDVDKIDTILNLNTVYVTRVEHYNNLLTMAMDEVEKYCASKMWLCEIRCFVRKWESVEKYRGSKAQYIQEVLQKLQYWSEHVDSMNTEFDSGNNLLHLSCSALYSALQPALGEIYQSLVDMVQSEFQSRGANLIEETKDKHQMLKSQKAEVSHFADYAKTLSNVKLSTEKLLREKEYIKSLYGILQKLKIDNPLIGEIDKRLHLQWELYLMVLYDGETFINKEAPSMLQGLDEQIKTIEIEAELILRKISQPDSAFCDPTTDFNKIVPMAKESTCKIQGLKDTMTKYSDWKFSITNNYHNMQKIQLVQTKVEARYDVWDTLKTVSDTVATWEKTDFSKFDTEAASLELSNWLQMADQLRVILPDKDRILHKLDMCIEHVSKFIPILVQLSSESVKLHHWQEIYICMGEMYDAKQSLLVSHLMTNKLLQNREIISRICGQALTEHTLERNMSDLEQYWEEREFTLKKILIPKLIPNSKTRKVGTENVFILDIEDNIIRQIDDHQVLLQSILASPYVKDLQSRAEMWLVLLQQLHVIMHIWPICHTNWLFLTDGHVYGKIDVLEEDDVQQFLEMDRDFRQLQIVTWEDPLVMSLFGRKSLSNIRELQGDKLITRLEGLQRVQEGLMSKLESIVHSCRGKLPRLFFVSNDDLLSALRNADSASTARHVISSCFPNILDISIEPRIDDKDPLKITHIHGAGNEVVPLIQPVALSDDLVLWLSELQGQIIESLNYMMYYSLLNIEHTELQAGSLKFLLGDINVQNDPYSELGAHKEYIQNEGSLQNWLSDYPFQCLLTVHNVVFTIKLNEWIDKTISYLQINMWIQSTLSALVNTLRELNPRCALSGRKSTALQAILLQLLSHRDRLNVLRGVENLTSSSFAVLAIPRFSITPHSGRYDWVNALMPMSIKKSSPTVEVTVNQLTAEMSYDYEYLGQFKRLVITPITERVHLSLASAITLRQTLALTGPSNAGKFETVKDYANILGRYCVEFSDTFNPRLLTDILAGLAQTGCWVVVRMFEETELLSELAQVLQAFHRGFASLAEAKFYTAKKCPVIPREYETRPSSHLPHSKTTKDFVLVDNRPESVSSQIDITVNKVPPVPNYIGNIIIGDRLIPASGSFQCVLTLPPTQKLPPNIKDCCRTTTMLVPDLEDIILAKLLSSGYKHYDHLSTKLTCFLTYLNPMVSKIDLFTLPIVKGILNYATTSILFNILVLPDVPHNPIIKHLHNIRVPSRRPSLVQRTNSTISSGDAKSVHDNWAIIKASLKEQAGSEQLSSVSISSVEETMTQIEEERILIDAVVSALTPMLSVHQRGLMKQVLQEVFPLSVSHMYNTSVPPRVRAMVTEQFESNKYEVVPSMLEKTLELYHVIQNRKCVILVGPTSCGKTTIVKLLSNAINFMQATEARAHKDRCSVIKESSDGTPLPYSSKYGTPLPGTEHGSRAVSGLSHAPPASSESRRATLRSETLRSEKLLLKGVLAFGKSAVVQQQKPLNILQKPTSTRSGSVYSTTPSNDSLSDKQKIRILRLFINTLTFDEFVGAGITGSEDGIFINLCKKFSSQSSTDEALQNWIFLDGNLKTYMESMLSTAISNKVISALDGSQIRVKDNVQFFIETDTLSDVTPSFITKCGVVTMNSSIVGWRQRFRSWLKKAEKEYYLTKTRVFTITVLMETFIGQMLQFLDLHAIYILKTDKNHTQEVSALLRWLDLFFSKYITQSSDESSAGADNELYLNSITVLVFLMSYIWSFGGNIEESCREAYSDFVKQQISECNHHVIAPHTGTVFDWSINDTKLKFELWAEHFSDMKHQSSVTFTTTILHEKTLYLTELLQSAGVPVAIVGPSSSGKSSFINNCVLPKLHPTKIKVSHLSSMRSLEDNIENRMIQHQRRQQAMTSTNIPSLLIEDFNVIPQQGPSTGLQEVLRKVLASGETYSFKRKVFRNLGGSHFVLTCNSTESLGAGGNMACGEVIERLWNYFNILPLHCPTEEEWRGIFYPIVLSWLGDFPAYKLGFKTILASAIVGATCRLYEVLKTLLKPVPGYTHHIFDAHALSQVYQGIFLMSPTSKFRQMRQNLKGATQPERRRAEKANRMQSVNKKKSLKNDKEMISNIAHLWTHETERIFTDRIFDDEKRSEVYRNIQHIMKEHFCSIIVDCDASPKSVAEQIKEKYTTDLSLNTKKHILGLLSEELEDIEVNHPLIEQEELMSDLPVIASDLLFTKYLVENSETYSEEPLRAILDKLDNIMCCQVEEDRVKSSIAVSQPSHITVTDSSPTVVPTVQHQLLSFSKAAKHCARLSRSLMLGGHSILLGPCGSGRKVLARATAVAHNYLFRYIPSPSSGVDFNTELVAAMITAGSNAQSVLLFIEDGWDTDILADIMYFLGEGNHPSMIDPSQISSTYGNVNMDEGTGVNSRVTTSHGKVLDVFYKRVQTQLHIVFSLNTTSSGLPEPLVDLLALYPTVLKRCNCVDTYSLWSAETLAEIAQYYLNKQNKEGVEDEPAASTYSKRYSQMLSNMAANVHLGALEEGRKELSEISTFVNPCSYLDLLNIYSVLESRIKSDILAKLGLLNSVFEKIKCVEDILKDKRSKLMGLAPILKTAQVVYQGWLEEIRTDKAEYSTSQDMCKKEEAVIAQKQAQLEELRQLNDIDQQEVSPLLQSAVEALDSITKAAIEELKSYKKPPELVKMVMEPLCILFEKEPSWEGAMSLLHDMRLLHKLVDLRKDNIKNSTLKKIKAFLDYPDFNEDKICSVSFAAKCICIYVSSVYKYSTIVKTLRPKERKVEKITLELEESQRSLGKKWLYLEELKKSLDTKTQHHDHSANHIKEIQTTMKGLKKEVRIAEQLLDCLKVKITQWRDEKEDLESRLAKADGDAMLAAGAITYFGPFTSTTRDRLMTRWKECSSAGQSFITDGVLPRSPLFDIVTMLSTPTELLNLAKRGLPKDSHSLQNVLILRELLRHSNRQIFVSDPDNQLRQWTSSLLSARSITSETAGNVKLSESVSDITQPYHAMSSVSEEFTRSSDMDLLTNISSETVVYHSVSQLADLDPSYVKPQNSSIRNVLNIITGVCEEGTTMPNISNIRDNCLLTTTLPTSQLSTQPLKDTVVLNFSLSDDGVINFLLKMIINKQAAYLITKDCAYAKSKLNRISSIKNAEDSLLEYINAYKGNLLDSVEICELIVTNRDTIKNEELAILDINAKLDQLSDKTDEYRSFAEHGAIIVHVLHDLNTLSFHYNFSLTDVVDTLNTILNKKSESVVSISTSAKVTELKQNLHQEIHQRLGLATSPDDIHFFPLLLVMKQFLKDGRLTKQEYSLFLQHSVHQFPYYPDQIPTWITKKCWQSLDLLEGLDVFNGIKLHMQANQALYQEYYTLSPVLLEPSPWDDVKALTLIQRALLWTFCRPAEMHKVYKDLVMYELGSEMINVSTLSPLSEPDIYPTLLLSNYNDQLDVVFDIKQKAGVGVRVLCMLSDSLQDDAVHLINQGTKYGYCVVLTQCQYIKTWTPNFLDSISSVASIMANRQASLPKRVHPSFNLILVSSLSSHLTIPVDIQSKFSIRTYHSEQTLSTRIEQGTKMFLEDMIPLSTESLPAEIPTCLSNLHSYLIEHFPRTKEADLLDWNHSDLFSTLHLLCYLGTLNQNIDHLDATRSLVGLVTYGSKCMTELQTNFLYYVVDKFLNQATLDTEETSSSQPSFLQIQLGSSSVQSLPAISSQKQRKNTRLTRLERLCAREEVLDVAFVTNYMISALPTAPRDPSASGHTALSQFFSQQSTYYTSLLDRVTEDLVKIQDILQGLRTAGPHDKRIMSDLSKNKVPVSWEEPVCTRGQGLGRWVSEICDRVVRLAKMVGTETQSEMSGRHSSSIAASSDNLDLGSGSVQVYMLPTFTCPRSFLLSYLYDWACANSDTVALSDVTFKVKVVSLLCPGGAGPPSQSENGAAAGIMLEGLELEKSGWDTIKGLLYPTSASSPPFPLPPVLLLPFDKHNNDESETSVPQMTVCRIDCPVYSRSGDLITSFVLPSSHSLNQWTLHGKPSLRIM